MNTGLYLHLEIENALWSMSHVWLEVYVRVRYISLWTGYNYATANTMITFHTVDVAMKSMSVLA